MYQGRKMDKNEELVNSPKKYTAHKSGLWTAEKPNPKKLEQ